MSETPNPGDPWGDREQADFIEDQSRDLPFAELAASCRDRFGADRAWPRDKIIEYWTLHHPPGDLRSGVLTHDREVREFVMGRLGRMSADRIIDLCIDKFGPERTPASSTIYDNWKKWRRDMPRRRRRR